MCHAGLDLSLPGWMCHVGLDVALPDLIRQSLSIEIIVSSSIMTLIQPDNDSGAWPMMTLFFVGGHLLRYHKDVRKKVSLSMTRLNSCVILI